MESEETMFERFARAARAAVVDARTEAGRRGDRRIGSEHLLIALLQDEELAQLVGADADDARAAVDEMDRAALAAIGVDLGGFAPAARAALGKHVPFSSGAKAVLQRSLSTAAGEKAAVITPRHMLLALLDLSQPDQAAALFARLSADPAAVRERVARKAS